MTAGEATVGGGLSRRLRGMPTRKSTQAPRRIPPRDLHSAVLDQLRRGQEAQAKVDAILAAEPERWRAPRPKGHA